MVWWNHQSYFHEHSGGTSMDNLRLLHLKPVPQGDLWLHRHYPLVNSHSYRKWPIYRRFTVPIKMEMFKSCVSLPEGTILLLGSSGLLLLLTFVPCFQMGLGQSFRFHEYEQAVLGVPQICHSEWNNQSSVLYIHVQSCACIYPKIPQVWEKTFIDSCVDSTDRLTGTSAGKPFYPQIPGFPLKSSIIQFWDRWLSYILPLNMFIFQRQAKILRVSLQVLLKRFVHPSVQSWSVHVSNWTIAIEHGTYSTWRCSICQITKG